MIRGVVRMVGEEERFEDETREKKKRGMVL
jgi:hypothetical protein